MLRSSPMRRKSRSSSKRVGVTYDDGPICSSERVGEKVSAFSKTQTHRQAS